MTTTEKLAMLNSLLGTDSPGDELLTVYLNAAKSEIIGWRYSYAEAFLTITDVPVEYEMTQVMAVIAGFSIRGAEGQTLHEENSIRRTFKYEDMVSYIRAHVIPICGVI